MVQLAAILEGGAAPLASALGRATRWATNAAPGGRAAWPDQALAIGLGPLERAPDGLQETLLLVALAGLALVAGYLFEISVIRLVKRLAARTATTMDDAVVRAVRPGMALVVVFVAFHAGLAGAGDAVPEAMQDLWSRLALALAVLVAAVVAARLLAMFLRHWARHHARFGPLARMGTRLSHVAIYIVAFLVVLGSYGVSITPLVTSLGIAGLAVALALQDTLANFFAGLWIQSGQSMQPGHYVKLEGGQLEGYVEEIGWRTTRIRMLHNNVIVVPNAKLAQTIVTDFHLPAPQMTLLMPVGVGYECDPRRVEAVLLDEAKKAVGEVDGLLGDPAPFVRFIPGFGDYSLQFTMYLTVREYVDQFPVQHEMRMRIFHRFQREGIRIPYPIRESFQVPATRPDVAGRPPEPGAPAADDGHGD